MDKRKQTINKLSAPALILWFYLGTLAVGTALLMIPGCNHEPIRLIDAFFSAASALTGAGLMSVVPAVQFTAAGKVILLLLIQVGGLAIVASLIIFAGALKERIRQSQREWIQDMFSLGRL